MTPRRQRPIAYLLTAILFYAVFLIATLPADWMGTLLTRFTGGAVGLKRASGSFWHGSGDLAVRTGASQTLQTRIGWTIQPYWLLAGKLQARLESSGDIDARATIRLGYRSIDIRDCDGRFRAAAASAVYFPLTLAALTGQAQFFAERLALDSGGIQGTLDLKWLNAGSRINGMTDLGDYRLVLTGQGAAVGILADTQRGDVQLNAKGSWQAQGDGALSVDGTLTGGSREAVIAPLLALLNARRAGNAYEFSVRARIPSPLPHW
jgi:hypothetical protein